MNRSNSFVSSLKWWPLQGHNNQATPAAPSNGGSAGYSQSAPSSPTSNWPPSLQQQQHHHHHKLSVGANVNATFGSSVAVQKLRESKWFKPEEQRIFCAVVECGFIVEVRSSAAAEAAAVAAAAAAAAATANDADSLDIDCPPLTLAPPLIIPRNGSSSISFLEAQDENETPVASWYGIVLCKVAKALTRTSMRIYNTFNFVNSYGPFNWLLVLYLTQMEVAKKKKKKNEK
ncbi:uncharacterized protein l(1)G0469 isoform X2 [Drosophila virilis]|uniref:uncharacterized protein l(1)G0469 isoform X2 n=1 Tax=Drosophila virilis TaxID=7244 RepID=UPI0038B263B5